MSPNWSIDTDLAWDAFRPDLVDQEMLKIIKAACLVEANATDYAAYLCNIFRDDPAFQRLAQAWAVEEVQHGEALARWAKLADTTFDFDDRLARFRDGFQVQIDSQESVRGSRTGELVARCMVEVGTSSYYTAIADASEEPLLREICRRIATDEWRHYALFYKTLKRYLEIEPASRFRRLAVAVGRASESEDDELSYAFFAANAPLDAAYDRKTAAAAYMSRALGLYRPQHVERAMAMIFKAIGFEPRGRVSRTVTRGVSMFMARRARRHAA